MNYKPWTSEPHEPLYLDSDEIQLYKIHLRIYMDSLEARSILELKQLNILIAKIKRKVNARRMKLGLPKLG